jgi:carbamoyltransferase
MRGARLGPSFSDADIRGVLERAGVAYRELAEGERAVEVARLLDEGRVVGIFSGAMEFGPRALGGRSILADARRSDMQQQLNRRIKFREGFRPFAPVCLAHRAAEWFDVDRPLPYMTVVVHVREERRTPTPPVADGFVERAAQVRSVLPAITHVDHTARLQTVDAEGAPLLHAVLSAFEARTGCPVLVNTSFNLRGEPIVCTPEDAFRCWARSGMDAVLLGSFLVEKQARETLL